jgi:hypothetical protein
MRIAGPSTGTPGLPADRRPLDEARPARRLVLRCTSFTLEPPPFAWLSNFVEPSNLRTFEPSNLRTFEPSNPRTVEPSNRRTAARGGELALDLLSSIVMDVFVIPVARDRYELYCETSVDADEVAPADAPEPVRGWRRWRPGAVMGRLRARFSQMLRAAEQRQRQHRCDEPQGWLARTQDRMMAWIVERIAEQRLLWNLRRETSAVLVHPQDMVFEQVHTLVRRTLQRDYERHRRWLVIDTLLMIVSGALAIVPGPNILAYYFIFRVVGHWLSMRGARQGLDCVQFAGRPCPPLSELREIADLEPSQREQRIHDIAGRLRLANLATFYARVAV